MRFIYQFGNQNISHNNRITEPNKPTKSVEFGTVRAKKTSIQHWRAVIENWSFYTKLWLWFYGILFFVFISLCQCKVQQIFMDCVCASQVLVRLKWKHCASLFAGVASEKKIIERMARVAKFCAPHSWMLSDCCAPHFCASCPW